MIDIAIKGSCVSREAFNYQKELFNEEIFHVSNYIFQKPIAVIETGKVTNVEQNLIDKLKVELINQESVQDFVVNQVNKSFSKEFHRDVNEKEKYFMLDFVDERMHLIKIGDSFIEYRNEFIKVLSEEKINYEVVRNSKDVFFRYIDRFIHTIKEKYPEENIILHKAYAVNTTKVNDTVFPLTSTFANPLNARSINSYSIKRATSVNLFFLEVYQYIETNYPDIKVIELPIKNYFSPSNHKYGRGFYHYDDQYYVDFLQKLKEMLMDKNTKKNEQVAKENKSHIRRLQQMQEIIVNLYQTKNVSKLFTRNPEELLFGPLNSPINYQLTNGGKPLVKSYYLNDVTPGIMIFDNQGEIKGKFILNTNNEIERIYTFHKNKNAESITSIDADGVATTTLFDESKRDMTKQCNMETINREQDNVYSVYNQNKEMVIRVIDHTKVKRKRVIFYQNNRICTVIFLANHKIQKVINYDNNGRIFEEFSMGEYSNIGKVHVKMRYSNNKKKIRYFFHATGNIQSRTLYTDDERYLKTEIYDEHGKVRKEVVFNAKGKKTQVIDFLPEGRKKISDYFDSGTRNSITFYQNDQLIKKMVRNNAQELFHQVGNRTDIPVKN